ncbi:carotenoid oxygenase family protein [Natronomonas halophila]|uniref:carotenoid oxygenase family protein n=1 Tax=Natronomonas halophila TaxID=2747817 RepID=UPI0015B4FA0A|nr:carotenoid oxygenase family protein [Natronomonas halophila]QLD87298.1 carotenoid oxygenase family protein [Natronomonas halophila]
MASSDRAYELGFRSLDEEVSARELPVEGSVPTWLSGALIRNGPGSFEFGDERATHWFDGLAMLRRYAFSDGTVRYTNRFLRTEAYEDAESGATAGEFASGGGPLREALRWLRALGPPEPTDNANVHVARFGGHHVALTEAPRRIAFDAETLETRGEFRWNDDIPEHLATAHFAVDPHRDETVGYATAFGRQSTYHFYRIPDGSAERERFASVDAEGPGYVHDCAITENYAILVEPPLRIALLRALAPWQEGLLDMLEYDEDRRARFIVVDRDSGDLVADLRTAPFFVFHHINAYEDGDDVVVDLVAFENADIVEALGFDALSGDAFDAAPDGRLVRFRLSPETGEVSRSRQYDGGLELPTVPRAVRGRPYRYAYAQATDRRGANGLAKIDVESGTATEWWERGVYVEEPRMVQHPEAEGEDEGVVLAPALDTEAERSILLIFDAETLTELARAPLPHVVPFGFHGRYLPEA